MMRRRHCGGGSTFAEDPRTPAPAARLIWHAQVDPGTLVVDAVPACPNDPEAFDPAILSRWLTVVRGNDGYEHAVLSDGTRRVRLDVTSGTLRGGPVILRFEVAGMASLGAKLMPLRRLEALCRGGRFVVALFPADPRMKHWLEILRVHDALQGRASQREIAQVLFGFMTREDGTEGAADAVRSRVRRRVRLARQFAQGAYRQLMNGAEH
ncbi:DUF2285 domain-containing protein [Novosphingobium sp. BL-8H]|uniref:DNA -binding domain-containing protein n=1 Tax=Novosphingobium sp. BL-8H TaxID=3127640 RepID=UPI003757C799